MATSETMKIIIQAQDEARATLARLAKELNDLDQQANKSARSIAVLAEGVATFKAGIKNLKDQVFTLKNAVIGAVAAFGTWKIFDYIRDSTLLAARYKTLGVTLDIIGKQAGYNAGQLALFEDRLKKTGIASIEARTVLTRMVQAQLDLTKSSELARVAQNAAVIANLNSSETLERMLHAIQANSVEILSTIGLNISFADSYKKLAKQLDINENQLTEVQKIQARFNAVLEGGVQIAGAYEAAMGTAGKQLKSYERYVQEFRIAIGKAFEPTLAVIVDAMTKSIKEFTEAINNPTFQKNLVDFAKVMGEQVKAAFTWLIDNKEAILNVIVEITKSLGDAILSLNRLLELVFGSQKRLLENQKENFGRIATDLAKFVAQREELIKKLEEQSKTAAFFDFGKTEREIKQLDVLIKKYTELAKGLDVDIKKKTQPEPDKTYKPSDTGSSIFMQYQTFLKPTKNKDPLGSSLMASEFKRATEDIKHELSILSSEYENHIIKLGLYYDERERLAKLAFENELKYLQTKAGKEPDADKRLKIEDQIYALKKSYNTKTLALDNERTKAIKKQADDQLEIEKTLQSARLAVLEKSTLAKPEEKNKIELEQLRTSQAERLKSLVDGQANEKQLRENKITNVLEEQALTESQEKRHVQRILEIRRLLEDVKSDIAFQDPTTSQAKLDKIELEQLKRTQEDRLKTLKAGGASRDDLKENEILSERERQITVENQQKSSAQKTLEIQRTLEQARLALIDPNNLQAVFDAEKAQLDLHQADRLQSIKDAKLSEQAEIEAIEEAGRISQLEKDKQQADQRLRIQEAYTVGVAGILSDLNSLFGDLYEAGGKKQKEWFHLQKAIAVAQTIMATYEAAQKAYTSMAGIPYVGVALGAAAAGVAVAAGLAKVAVIRSQSYAEGGVVKGYSPSPKADNIKANLTAGEYVHPVDVVKYYGLKGMDIIRQKLIPPELLYQISSFKEKKESIKESFQKNLERTNDFMKDYSKQILGISKRQSDKVSDSSLVSKSKMTSVIDRSISTSATDRTASDRQEVIVTKLFDKLISDKSSNVESKEKHTKELIQDVRRDKEITTRDRRTARDIYRERQSIIDRSKVEQDTRYTDRIRTSDRSSSERYENQLIANSLVVKKKTKKKKYKYYSTDEKQDSQSRIHIGESISDRQSFLNTAIESSKLIIDKSVVDRLTTSQLLSDKLRSTFDKSFASTEASKAISEKFIQKLQTDKLTLSAKTIMSTIDKSVIDNAINQSISDRLVSDNVVEKSAISQSLIDKVVSRLAIDRSHVADSLIDKSYIKEVITKSASDEVLNSLKSEVSQTHIDKAINKLIGERIVERTLIQNADLQKDKLILSSDSYYKLDSKNVDFTKSILQSPEIDKSRESIREVIAESKIKDLKESVSKTKDKTIIEKSISFVKNIAETVQKIIPTVNPQPVMVMSPVVIRDTISKTESFTKLKSKQLKNMNIASNFIKMVESRTNQTIQQLASGGSILGSSPHSKADNIDIKATAGEFMQPVDVVKFYTNKGMEAIRQKIIPREVIAHYANNIQLPKPNYSHAFAMGGEIPKTRETSDSAADKSSEKQLNIVNLIDPAVFGQYMASSTGEQQFINVISANKFAIKNILGS